MGEYLNQAVATITTNVITSAIFFGGKPFELLNLIVKGQVEVFVTPDISKHIKRTITS